MSNVTELKVVAKDEQTREMEDCLKSFDEKVAKARKVLEENPDAGFGIFCYYHGDVQSHGTWGAYHLARNLDCYVFPDMARTLFARVREECGFS